MQKLAVPNSELQNHSAVTDPAKHELCCSQMLSKQKATKDQAMNTDLQDKSSGSVIIRGQKPLKKSIENVRGISNCLFCQLFWLSLLQQFDFSWSAAEAKTRCFSPLKPSLAGQTEPPPDCRKCTAVLETSETSTVLHDDRERELSFLSHSLE